MNTNFTLFQRKARTLSLGRRNKYRGLGLSTSVESMAQLHPPHVEHAQVVEIHSRILEPKRKVVVTGMFVYQIDINWSDGTTTASYRSYSDFFDFQCSLLVEFPVEGGRSKGSERTIPYLPGKRIFKKSTYDLALQRQPQIQEYLTKLLSLPEHISKCERLLRFFRSNWQEDRLRSGDNHGVLSTSAGGGGAVKYSVRHMRPMSEYGASPAQSDSSTDQSITRSESKEPIVLGI